MRKIEQKQILILRTKQKNSNENEARQLFMRQSFVKITPTPLITHADCKAIAQNREKTNAKAMLLALATKRAHSAVFSRGASDGT